jgi:hypothetical protein
MLFCDGSNNQDILDAYEPLWQTGPMEPFRPAVRVLKAARKDQKK